LHSGHAPQHMPAQYHSILCAAPWAIPTTCKTQSLLAQKACLPFVSYNLACSPTAPLTTPSTANTPRSAPPPPTAPTACRSRCEVSAHFDVCNVLPFWCAYAYCTNCMPLKVRPTFQLRVEPWFPTAALMHPAAFMRSVFAWSSRHSCISANIGVPVQSTPTLPLRRSTPAGLCGLPFATTCLHMARWVVCTAMHLCVLCKCRSTELTCLPCVQLPVRSAGGSAWPGGDDERNPGSRPRHLRHGHG